MLSNKKINKDKALSQKAAFFIFPKGGKSATVGV
jgi:hypothetical protein